MKVGQNVRWISQSQGFETEKHGEIIAAIPAGESAFAHVPETAKKSHIKFKDVSEKDRFLVAVPAGKDGKIIHYYCPLRTMLKGVSWTTC